jgi:uncharacterized protein (DUF433 family)
MEMSDDRIVVDPDKLAGAPHVNGTERPVNMIIDLVEAELSYDEIIAAYPELTREDIEAALAYGRT